MWINLAILQKENNTLIIPADIGSVSGMVASAMSVLENTKKNKNKFIFNHSP